MVRPPLSATARKLAKMYRIGNCTGPIVPPVASGHLHRHNVWRKPERRSNVNARLVNLQRVIKQI